MQLSHKQKTFSEFLGAFLKSTRNFKYFPNKITLIDFVFPKFRTPKTSWDKRPFDKQHGKRAQALFKSVSQHLYHINWSLPGQLSCEKSLFLTCPILELLVNTLAADQKYPVLNRDNLTIPIQMQLSQKQKNFSQFLGPFLQSTRIFKYY